MQLFQENHNNYYERYEYTNQLTGIENLNYWETDIFGANVEEINERSSSIRLHPEIEFCNFKEIMKLSFESEALSAEIALVKKINDFNQLTRLNEWLGFFLETWNLNFTQLAFLTRAALTQFAVNGFIHSQTTWEFELSKLWLKELADNKVEFKEQSVADILLITSVLIGCNPALLNRARTSVYIERKLITSINIGEVINSLTTEHAIPEHLIQQLHEFNYTEQKVIVEMLFGKNLRKCPSLSLPISKKESSVLRFQFVDTFTIDINKLEGLVVLAKLVSFANKYSYGMLHALSQTDSFIIHRERFMKDLSYWKQVYKFATQINRDLIWEVRPSEYFEYFEKLKYELNRPFNFKGRTIESIMRQIIEEKDGVIIHEQLKLKWKPTYKTRRYTTQANETFEFRELTTGKQLHKEGRQMNHCVFSYYTHLCFMGAYSIVSLRKISEGNAQRLVTIALDEKRIVEAKGKNNRALSRLERHLIEKWMEKMNVSLLSF